MSNMLRFVTLTSVLAVFAACTKTPNNAAKVVSESSQNKKISCTLRNSDAELQGSIELTNNPDSEDGSEFNRDDMDLSFYLQDSINDDGKHVVEVLFSSVEVADEVGSLSIEIPETLTNKPVIEEPITGAVDGKDYMFVCTVQ